MAVNPQGIRETSFRSARRGYDPGEVDAFVQEVAGALETAQNDATAMEARARAAVARLQELSQGQVAQSAPIAAPETETISRTLLLAQRTADQTVADAQAEADRVLVAAQEEASGRLDGARTEAAELVEEAKRESTREGEAERVRVEGEVQALIARREFLESDVEHLEQFIMAQRERIVEATSELQALCQRVPSGLADMRRPLLSPAASAASQSNGSGSGGDTPSEIRRVAAAEQAAAADHDAAAEADDEEPLPPPDHHEVGAWTERH